MSGREPAAPQPRPPAAGPARTRATGAFERRVARALGADAGGGAPLIVACSGGPDSSAALAAVARAREAAGGGETIAATFDHGLRPSAETRADREAVEALAGRFGLRCVAGAPPAPIAASEAAARAARYRWLGEAAIGLGARACATGHTLDDQAETVLLRLTRGAGAAGAAGMAASAPWPVALPGGGGAGAPRLLRPLLELRRAGARGYLEALGLEALGLAPRSDPGNETLAYARNRVRRAVLPELRRLNPRAEEALAGFARRARRDDAALADWAAAETRRIARAGDGEARVGRRALRALPEAVALRVLRAAAAGAGIPIGAAQAEALLRAAARGGARVALPGGGARTDGGDIRIERSGGG